VPGKATRPTTDKVKEAIFSKIGPYFAGGTALDLFAGTGSLGIEALSRGMDRAVFIDIDRQAIEVIMRNVQAAGFAGQAEIYRNEAFKALKILAKKEEKFDLVFLDPPYKLKITEDILSFMDAHAMCGEGAVAVAEHDAETVYAEQIGRFSAVSRGRYGETAITIYRYNPNEEVVPE
jgi:16S rRNA (guanine(966)-N(2))-methyltransferase RsmD